MFLHYCVPFMVLVRHKYSILCMVFSVKANLNLAILGFTTRFTKGKVDFQESTSKHPPNVRLGTM